MGDPIYVSLDDLVIRDDDKVIPVKPFDEGILNGTFGELIDRMMDTSPDLVYNHKYNIDEIKFIERFKQTYTHALNQSNSMIEIYAQQDNDKKGPFSTDSVIADYREDVLYVDEIDDNGQKTPYKAMDLLVRVKSGGA